MKVQFDVILLDNTDGVKTMNDKRSLFDALGAMSLLVAAGIVAAMMFG
jgi:hypothetical protein